MIYLDAVWLLNFLVDGMILIITQAVTKSYTTMRRIMFAALIASLIVPLTIFFSDSWLVSPLGKFAYSMIIILAAFPYKSIAVYLRNLTSFYFVTFAIGGALFASHFFLRMNVQMSAPGMVTFSTGYGDPISWMFVLIGFPVAWWFTKQRLQRIAILKLKYEEIYDVILEWNGKRAASTGLVDSGNHLSDPLTNKLVFLGDEEVFRSFVTEEEWSELKEVEESYDINRIPDSLQESVHFIPYKGASGERKLMLALQLDKIELVSDEKKKISMHAPLLGLQFGRLTDDDSYHVLLHPEMMQKGKVA
ncbi:stage II sporulation protein GA (sporulation sigma-E factor processing peptidase) [Thalassobacillus cyri]|uniref:Sporulation sigma-E factor-processing peptidase n=1 Tax=Thalassobacillus cyri TaxID=571932 RepID=A0A1H4H6L0_9BACI|nr:sigma-E processing peptidase SpoIIGA [Thalassobacillus cyri]SEB17399.1 stage II sporulation protein GA (sporulation sigma-E factor processing peptidase) [Thalassobacillus cyri]